MGWGVDGWKRRGVTGQFRSFRAARSPDFARYAIRLRSGRRAITPACKLAGDPIQSGCAFGAAAFLARMKSPPASNDRSPGTPSMRALPIWWVGSRIEAVLPTHRKMRDEWGGRQQSTLANNLLTVHDG
jgi:hypothetical protein